MATNQKTYTIDLELLPRGEAEGYRLRIYNKMAKPIPYYSSQTVQNEEEVPGIIIDWLKVRGEQYLAYFPSRVLTASRMRYYIVTEPVKASPKRRGAYDLSDVRHPARHHRKR